MPSIPPPSLPLFEAFYRATLPLVAIFGILLCWGELRGCKLQPHTHKVSQWLPHGASLRIFTINVQNGVDDIFKERQPSFVKKKKEKCLLVTCKCFTDPTMRSQFQVWNSTRKREKHWNAEKAETLVRKKNQGEIYINRYVSADTREQRWYQLIFTL